MQRSGSRRPIFYLRAFALDTHLQQHEEAVVRELRKVGPVIAIGRPGEPLPPLGAARFYVDDAHWKAKVADVVRVAQLVVWTTGVTEGLRWEIMHLRESLPPERLILWAHPPLLGLWGPGAEAEWTRFVSTLGSIFPHPLPAPLADRRFFFFNSRWEPFSVSIGGDGTQVAALKAALDAKGIRKAPSAKWSAIRLAATRIGIFAIWAVLLIVVLLQLFRRR